VITAAITGSITSSAQTPYLPTTVDEIVEAAVTSWSAGAAIVHLHARDADGVPCQDTEVYRMLVSRIRERDCDAILNISTGSAGGRSRLGERTECLVLDPEMATLDCGSMNYGDDRIFENPMWFLRETAAEMRSRNIVPEIEVFDAGMISNGLRLISEGLIAGPGVWQLALGVLGGAPADLATVSYLLSRLPEGAFWSILGTGRHQLSVNLISLTHGGHVRTGLEDNVYYRKGELATGNAQFVKRVKRFADEVGRSVASPAEARQMLGMSS
jgi:3-keto-5-aminohexanoate cleavage enzyme